MLLDIKDLTVKYGENAALRNISMSVESGELTAVLGANGAGKTTLLRAISGVIRPSGGSIIYKGENIESLEPNKIVKKGISQCPEGRKVFPRQTVAENLRMGAFTVSDQKAVKERIEYFYKSFPKLYQLRSQLSGHLSGGEQQMLVICRALMSSPDLLLLDEPSMGLAPFIVIDVFNLIRKIAEEGTTILLVEQNARRALKLATKAYVLEVGKVVAEGSAKELLENQAIQNAYLS